MLHLTFLGSRKSEPRITPFSASMHWSHKVDKKTIYIWCYDGSWQDDNRTDETHCHLHLWLSWVSSWPLAFRFRYCLPSSRRPKGPVCRFCHQPSAMVVQVGLTVAAQYLHTYHMTRPLCTTATLRTKTTLDLRLRIGTSSSTSSWEHSLSQWIWLVGLVKCVPDHPKWTDTSMSVFC